MPRLRRPSIPAFLVRGTTATREAAARAAEHARSLAVAQSLLTPDEVAGDYDAARALMTTLGSVEPRPLTHEDLRRFQRFVKDLGSKFKGGISAQKVIDLSRKDDRLRAARQIRSAVPVAWKGAVVHFITNSGPGSEVRRHHVHVDFLGFEAAVASPEKPEKLAPRTAAGKVRFSCDCGRSQYWYSYLQTLARCKYGAQQHNYPKIRNPKLSGLACKHVLRVMTIVAQSPTFRGYLRNMILQARRTASRRRRDTSVSDIREFVDKLAEETPKQQRVVTTAQKRLAQTLRQRARAHALRKTPRDPAAVKRAQLDLQRRLEDYAARGVITQAQYEAMLAGMKASG